MEKFIKMTASYIDSSRGVCFRAWRENVYYRRARYRVRHGGKRGIWGYILDLPGVFVNGFRRG